MFKMFGKPLVVNATINNDYPLETNVKLHADINFNIKRKQEKIDNCHICVAYMDYKISDEKDKFLFANKSISTFKYDIVGDEEVYKKCFAESYKYVKQLAKEITAITGFVYPLELPDISIEDLQQNRTNEI